VNPLHPGGKLRPFVDTAPPAIHDVRFVTPAMAPAFGTPIPPDRLRGVVDVNTLVGDPQSFRGWMRGSYRVLLTEHHPYELRAELRRLSDGRRWRWTVFRADARLDTRVPGLGTPVPFSHHFAPGSIGMLKTTQCLAGATPRAATSRCGGNHRLRLFASARTAFWDTRGFLNGAYRLTVTALDTVGNRTTASTALTIAN
jgi:hypothetical protein